MIRINHKRAQAATELAVFGAILIFLLGAIIRSAVGNSYTQNQSLKSMRMAMLASWQGALAARNAGAYADTSHNSTSILFVEDRLSPDISKYGDLERNPYIAQGSGTFTDTLLYPVDAGDAALHLPIMDVYINGQHFPFTTASFVSNTPITPPTSCQGTVMSPADAQKQCLQQNPDNPQQCASAAQTQCLQNQCFRNQREWVTDPVDSNKKYKLFYTREPNGTSNFYASSPPYCANPNTVACKNKALSSTLPLIDSNGNPITDASGNPITNINGDMEYDLLRNGDYAAVENKFPVDGGMRKYIAWQWAATLGTIPAGVDTTGGADPMIGLDPVNANYPTYDIDGRLKEVTIYTISQDQTTGYPTVSYEDPDGGDIDSLWDSSSCGPKPGLQSESQIYTFTSPTCKNGVCPSSGVCPEGTLCGSTYLQIKEGKLYNPETGQAVRSTNMRNTIDMIQRKIQLSNNTGRFCDANNNRLPCVGKPGAPASACPNDPNPVEACGTKDNNCFNLDNNKKTCFDAGNNMIYVRSRLQDRRGNSWMTNASGQLKVQ